MRCKPGLRVYLVAAVIGLAFGASVQYLGTVHVSQHFAASSTISAMSAPWLLLPFLAGARQRDSRTSVLVGLEISLFAVAGYTAMIVSPVEGAHPARALLATPLSQLVWFLAALVSGPVYGVLGYRWRAVRSRLSASLVIPPFLLEATAGLLRFGRWSWGDLVGYQIELAVGVAMLCYFAIAIFRSSLRARSATTTRSP